MTEDEWLVVLPEPRTEEALDNFLRRISAPQYDDLSLGDYCVTCAEHGKHYEGCPEV